MNEESGARSWWVGLAVVVLLATVLWRLLAAGGSAEAETVDQPLLVESLTVRQLDSYRLSQEVSGRITSRRASDLGFEREGRLDQVLVDVGERVREGQALARLDRRQLRARRTELEAQLAASEADLRALEARLGRAQLTTARRERLVRSETISQDLYDEARFEERAIAAQLDSARAAAAAARASIERIEIDLDLSVLRAPYDGTIIARLADEGTTLRPSQTLLSMIEDGELEAHIGVQPQRLAELEPGRPYTLLVDGVAYPARLRATVPSIETETRTATAIFTFERAPAGAQEGAIARLRLTSEVAEAGFWLPVETLSEGRRGLWTVLALAEGDEPPVEGALRVERRELQLVHVEADRAYVRGTLLNGERIVASGVHRLVPGQWVRTADDG